MQRRNLTERIESFVGEDISLDSPGDIFCEELDLRFGRREESEEPLSKKQRLDYNSEADEETDEEDEANDLFGNDDDTDVLAKAHQFIIFLRYYDPSARKLVHLGNHIFRARDTFGTVLQKARRIFLPDLDPEAEFEIGELLTPVQLKPRSLGKTLQEESIQNGDILYIERVEKKALRELGLKESCVGIQDPSGRDGPALTLAQWMEQRLHAVTVHFDHVKEKAPLSLPMNSGDNYEKVVHALNQELLTRYPHLADTHDRGMRIRLCKNVLGSFESMPFEPPRTLRRLAMPTLEELRARKFSLYWEVLPCRVDQVDEHIILKVLVLKGYSKFEELTVAMQARETVANLVETVRNVVAKGAGFQPKIRVFRTYNGHFDQVLRPQERLPRSAQIQLQGQPREQVSSVSSGVCRIVAEIDEEDLGTETKVKREEEEGAMEVVKTEEGGEEEGRLCVVTHAFVDERTGRAIEFFYPSTMYVRSTDTVGSVRERIRKRSKIPFEDFQKLKFVGFKAGECAVSQP